MKLQDLDRVKNLSQELRQVTHSYNERFQNKKNELYLALMYNNGRDHDQVPSKFLSLDVSLEGPIAALVDCAYRKKIKELEQQLIELGVDLESTE